MMTMTPPRDVSDFSDMDDLDSAPVRGPGRATAGRTDLEANAGEEACPKCNGRGSVTFGTSWSRSGPCYTCKGSGRVKVGYAKRAAAHRKGEATKAQRLRDSVEAFKAANPAIYAELESGSSDFIRSLFGKLQQYGELTPNQIAAVQKGLDARAARKAEQQASAPVIGTASGIAAALTKATRSGHKKPKIRTEVANFSLAPASGQNAGHVYVKGEGEVYLGKITPEGRFLASRGATQEQVAAVVAVAADALTAAVEYGKKTGRCSCCGRELTDPASIAAGIGPICAAGFF